MIVELLNSIPNGAWPAVTALMATVGAITAAIIAFIGVWLNNKSENNRRKKQRSHELIRETYFGAVEYIAYFLKVVASAGGEKFQELLTSKDSNTKNYYFLNLVASYEVMRGYAIWTNKATELISTISIKHIEVVNIEEQIKSEEKMRTLYQNQMDKLLNDHKELISKPNFSQESSDKILNFHQESLDLFTLSINKNDDLNRTLFRERLSILKAAKEGMKEIYPYINDVILLMRKDLDRKLSKKDSLKMKAVFEESLLNSTKVIEGFIQKLEGIVKEEPA